MTLGSKRPRFPELRVEERKLVDHSAIRVINLRLFFETPFYETYGIAGERVSLRYLFPPSLCKALRKIESLFRDGYLSKISSRVIDSHWLLGLTKANKRARIYGGNLISAEYPLENNRCVRFTVDAIGLNMLLWLC